MSMFWYKAYRIGKDKRSVEYETDTMVCDGDLAAELRSRGLRLIRARPVLFGSALTLPWLRVRARSLQTFWATMAMLVHLSIREALQTCAERTSDKRLAEVLRKVERSVRGGTSFADALAHRPEIPGLHAAIVAASGEQGAPAARAATYENLSRMTDNSAQLNAKMRKTLVRIVAVLAAALAGLRLIGGAETVVASVATSISPGRPYAEPALTVFAKEFVDAMTGEAATIATLVLIALAIALTVAVRISPTAGRVYERVLYTLPRFGKIARMIDTSRVSRALASTITVYAPADAVARVRQVAQRRIIGDALQTIETACRGKLGSGYTSLPDAVRFVGPLLDPLMGEYLTGARAGSDVASKALMTVADTLDRDAYVQLNEWADTVEPLLAAAAFMGFSLLMFCESLPLFGLLQRALTTHTPTYYIP